jgi:Response regulator containing CheY-like receiver, AAA-type ATPase, and DNA-binding domains
MNPGKATSFYHGRPQIHGYLDRDELERELSQEGQSPDFTHDSYARSDRLAESIRLKLLKVLTLTLLRELEGVGGETARSEKFDLQTEVQHFEAELIRSALIMTGGRQRRAAKLLGMKVTTLHSKIRRYGLHDTASGDITSGHEPSAAEAVRTSLELVEARFETERTPTRSSPEIHVTGEN